MILSHVLTIMLLVAQMVLSLTPEVTPQAPRQTLKPILYLPSITQPAFIQIGRLVRGPYGRGSDFNVRALITSTLSLPIYQTTIRVTAYASPNNPFGILTTTTFLPVLFPGQADGFRVIFKDGWPNIGEIKAEVISWTTVTTQTYLTPSFIFTPAHSSIYGTYVAGMILNDTGITLTNIAIATWSLYDSSPDRDVSTVTLLTPNQVITFSHILGEEMPLNSIRVGIQGIATP